MQGWGREALKIKNFLTIRHINDPKGRIPSAIYTKFSPVMDSFMGSNVLKFGQIRSRGFGVMGGLSLGVCALPKRRNYESDTNTFWRCKNGTDLLYHHARFAGAGKSHAARGRKCSTFVCPSRFLNDEVCQRHYTINVLEYGNDLGVVGKGNVCRCAHAFNFVCKTLGGANAE